MATLHLLANPNAAASCHAALAEADAVLLLDNGVFALPSIPADTRLGVLKADAERCAVAIPDTTERLSYAEMVVWVAAYDRSVTWS